MSTASVPPIDGVLFDFHSTLIDQGAGVEWVSRAWQHAGREGDPAQVLGTARVAAVAAWLDRIWEHARSVDPDSRRDLGPREHREVYDLLVKGLPDVDEALAAALYETMVETWIPYDDALPVLAALHERGVRTAVVSNIGIDIRPVLARGGLEHLVDAVVLSFETGSVKPDAAIFRRALDLIDVPPEHALMVGDSWRDDAGAAELGVRTLILPRTTGSDHGLDAVLRLVGA